MGTRADFYVGKGKDAEWLGSIAWDGQEIDERIRKAKTPRQYRARVRSFLKGRDDATWPKDGWPWPWDDSSISDCSYWHFDGKTWSAQGNPEVYVPCSRDRPATDEGYEKMLKGREQIEFPDMRHLKNVQFGGTRSGLMVVSAGPGGITVK